MSLLLGITGKKRHGKTTCAQILRDEHGYIPVALADTLRDLLYIQNPIVPIVNGFERLSPLVDAFGWEGIKDIPVIGAEVRRLLQQTGTEWGRGLIHGTIWIQALEFYLDTKHQGWWKESAGPRVVVTDIRFDNEAGWVHANRGKLIEVTRPEYVDDRDGHASEQGVDPGQVDYHVLNVGTKDELAGQLRDILSMEAQRVPTA